MKSRHSFVPFVLGILGVSLPAWANPGGPPGLVFSRGLSGTYNADWLGVAGRTYFMQFSLDLENWHYAPFIDFGGGSHRRGIESDARAFFIRLHAGDFPGITSLDAAMAADFDGDGLSNIFEITYGYDPFRPDSTTDGPDAALDPDQDGLGNAAEQAAGSNPMVRDHGVVELNIHER